MGKKYDNSRYEVITQEDPETGDLMVPLPPELLKQLGWVEGDSIDFSIDDKGRYVLQKKSQ
jgi:hypothetical protein